MVRLLWRGMAGLHGVMQGTDFAVWCVMIPSGEARFGLVRYGFYGKVRRDGAGMGMAWSGEDFADWLGAVWLGRIG